MTRSGRAPQSRANRHERATGADAPAPVRTIAVRMRYGAREVLHGVDLEVQRGETLALLGPNGAGKTTLVEILEGHRRRTGGDAYVLGRDPARADDAWRARIGVVLQAAGDHGFCTVGTLVDYVAAHFPDPWPAHDLLERIGLADQAKARVGKLSGGQRRRLDVALGLVGRPELLFLDEPTTGFDPEARLAVWELLDEIRASGTTTLLTTHDLHEAERLADRIAILAGGRILALGTADDLTRTAPEDGPGRSALENAYLHLLAGTRR